MKKSFLLISIFAVSITVSAAVVTPEKAIQVAQSFVPVHKTPRKNASGVAAMPTSQIVYTHYMPKSGRPAIYVVNVGNAYAIVSADDVAHPILGYNYSKSWPKDGNMPPQVKAFFDDLAQQMETAAEQPQDMEIATEWHNPSKRKVTKQTKTNNLPDSVGPLLTTTWDQGQYYNALCPADGQGPNGHVYSGCVATAMAQIINYWGQQQTIHTRGIHSYDCRDIIKNVDYGLLTVNYDSTTYDFTHMPDVLSSESSLQEVNAVAKLMYHCGVAVNMIYGPTESGAVGMNSRAALVNNYMFSSSTTYISRRGYKNADWEQIIQNQLAEEKPVIYSGLDTTGTFGHSFVCDGYKQDGYFHFNFGWGGNGDGWFQLSSVNPGIYRFDYNQAAIVNIAPSNETSILYDQLFGRSCFVVNSPMSIYNSLSNSAYQGIIDNWYYSNDTLVFYPDSLGAEIELTLNTLKTQSNWITYIRVYDGPTADSLIREFSTNDKNGYRKNDMSPIVSTKGALCVYINGPAFYDGYCFDVYKHNGCIRVTDIEVETDTTTAIVSWKKQGGANTWQVEYGLDGFVQGEGTIINVNDTFVSIHDLIAFAEYDVYVRSSSGNEKYGKWSKKISFRAGGQLWKNQVTCQPVGYEVDENDNIIISTKEGLAWLANEVRWNNRFEGRQIHLMNDVDMSGYQWTPIKWFEGSFYGHGHTINNLFIKGGGMFSNSWPILFDDIHLRNIYVEGGNGCFLGYNNRYMTITNCSTTGIINSDADNSEVGGIIGSLDNGNIINCWSSCLIDAADAYSTGGICGRAYKSRLKNCCFYGKVIMNYSNDIGGIIGYSEYTDIERCYALCDNFDGLSPIAHGGMGTTQKDLEWFIREDTTWTLMNPIAFENETTNQLLNALNNEVIEFNDSNMRTWIVDPISALPQLGDFYKVTCPNISDLFARNILNDNNEIGVVLAWTEMGDATNWEILYQQDTIIGRTITNHISDTIWGLTPGLNCMFCVRSICDNEHHSGWSKKLNHMVDRPYWVEKVTSKPEGFDIASNGDVTISTAEGLAWLIRVVNGLNGDVADNFSGKTVSLNQDIDLKQYKWTPINYFSGTFDGRNHVVKNLSINELTDYCGFFGRIEEANCRNLILDSVDVIGKEYVGGLIGHATYVSISNCYVSSGNIYGELYVGGVLGAGGGCIIDRCSFVGEVKAKHHYAGGLIGEIWENHSYVRNCYALSNVSINGYAAGGLVGEYHAGIIENCYSVGKVNGFAYNGGLLASCSASDPNSSSVSNCYTNVHIDESTLNGVIIGSTYGSPLISYCYGPANNLSIPLVGPVYLGGEQIPIVSDTASFAKLENNIVLNTGITIGETAYTDLLSALNAWVDVNNSKGIYRHWVADTDNVNGGFPIFDPTESPSTGINEASDNENAKAIKILRNGQIYILRGEKVYTLQGQEVK